MGHEGDLRRTIERIVNRYVAIFPDESGRCDEIKDQLRAKGNIRSTARAAGHITASGIVVHRPSASLLFIHHRGLGQWLQPGGHLKPGEMPVQAARREIQEETGLTRIQLAEWHNKTTTPIDIDVQVIRERSGLRQKRRKHFDFRYVFYSRTRDVHIEDQAEIDGVLWLAIHAVKNRDKFPCLQRALEKACNRGLLYPGL